LKPIHRNHIQNRIKYKSKSYQSRIKSVSKSYQNHIKTPKTFEKRPKTCPWAVSVSFSDANSLEPYQNRIKIISKPYQERIKIVSKPYQNHIKTIKIFEKSTENLSLGCFCFFSEANSLEPYQNRIKIISQSCQERIKIVSKPYQNIKTTKTREKSTKRLSRGCFRFLS
jgi:hypothetical protein